ncbi:hypothetical protein B0J13DRAFT_574498, partial [Dactylonectria estremocensis]
MLTGCAGQVTLFQLLTAATFRATSTEARPMIPNPVALAAESMVSPLTAPPQFLMHLLSRQLRLAALAPVTDPL